MSDVGEIVGRLRIEEGNWYRELDRAQEKADSLGRSNPRVTVSVSSRDAMRELQSTEAAANRLDRQSPNIRVDADTNRARGALEALERSAAATALAEQRMKAALEDAARSSTAAAALQQRLEAAQKDVASSALRAAAAEELLQRSREETASASARATAAEEARERASRQAVSSTLRAVAAEALLQKAENETASSTLRAAGAEETLEHAHDDAASAAVRHAAAEETLEGAIDRTSRRADSGSGRIALWTSAIIAAIPPMIPLAGVAVGGAVALGALGAAGILAGTGIMRGAKTGQGAYAAYRPIISAVRDDVYRLQDTAAAGLLPGAEKTLAVLEQKMPVINRGVDEFAGRLGQMAPTALSAVIGLLERGAPLWRAGSDWIGRMVQGLDDFGRSDAYKGFIDYSVRNLPRVERFLSEVVETAGDVLTAWAPMGEAALPVLTEVVSGVGDLIHALGPAAPAIAGVYLAFRAWTGIRAVIDGITTGLSLMGVKATVAGGQVAAAGTAARGAGMLAAAGWAAAAVALTQYAQATAAQANYDNTYKLSKGSESRKSELAGMASRASMKAPQSTGGGGMDAGLGAQINASLNKQRDAEKSARALAAAQDTVANSTRYAAQVSREQAANLAEQSRRATAAALAANNLAAKQLEAAGTAQSLEGANIGARSAIASVAAAAKDNGTALSGTSEKALANRQAMLGAVSGITAYGAAVQKSTGSAAAGQAAMDGMVVSLVKQATAAGYSKDQVSGLVAKLLGIPKQTVTQLLAIDEATPKALKAAASAKNFSVDKYRAVLEANGVPATVALQKAQAAARKWAAAHPKATIDGEASPAIAAAKRAQNAARQYMAGNYKAALKADPSLANSNIAQARRNAVQFGGLRPNAKLSADPSGAISGAARAKAAIAAVQSKTVTINAVYRATGSAQIAKNYAQLGGATGGTAGSSTFGSAAAIRGLAGGASTGVYTGNGAGYTVRGPGSAATDTAGIFRLANREEVISNLFGQADRHRVMLKAINSGDQARIRATAQEQYGGGQQQVVVHITGDDSALAGLVGVQVQQGLAAQSAAATRTVKSGWRNKGLMAGVRG